MRQIEASEIGEFTGESGNIVIVTTPTCIRCHAFFEKYGTEMGDNVVQYDFDVRKTSGSDRAMIIDYYGIAAVPATIARLKNQQLEILTWGDDEVDDLWRYLQQ